MPKFDDTPGSSFHREEAATKPRPWIFWRLRQLRSTNQTKYDVGFYSLDLLLDPNTPILSGTVEMTASVVNGRIDQVEMDLDGAMLVGAVRVDGSTTTFTHGSGVLSIDLDQSYTNGQSFVVSVDYSGRPNESLGAFGFDTQDGFPMIWSLSEPYGARTWWPCKDAPSDKADSARIKLTVPSSLTAISNGVLQSTSTQTVWKTFNWFEKLHRRVSHLAGGAPLHRSHGVLHFHGWQYRDAGERLELPGEFHLGRECGEYRGLQLKRSHRSSASTLSSTKSTTRLSFPGRRNGAPDRHQHLLLSGLGHGARIGAQVVRRRHPLPFLLTSG